MLVLLFNVLCSVIGTGVGTIYVCGSEARNRHVNVMTVDVMEHIWL